MKYSDLDHTLASWATRHSLLLYSEYKGEAVRSVDIVDDSGKSYQIWLEITKNENIKIRCWDKKNERKDIECSLPHLARSLDDAYSTVEQWIKEDGKTRTTL
jgi:hypothetical protein